MGLETRINNFNKAVGKGSKAQVDDFILLMMHSRIRCVTSLNEQRGRHCCEVSLTECDGRVFFFSSNPASASGAVSDLWFQETVNRGKESL